MKRITLFISLLCMIVGGVLAQTAGTNAPQAGKFYRIKSGDKYLTIIDYNENSNGATGTVPVMPLDQSNADQVWQVESSTESNFKLKSASGYYLKCRGWNTDAVSSDGGNITIESVSDTEGFYLRDADLVVKNGNPKNINENYFKCQDVNGKTHTYCDANQASAAKWVFEETSDFVLVTYKYQVNGKDYTSFIKGEKANSEATIPEQPYVTFGQKTAQINSEATQEVIVPCQENLPFVASNSFADAKWQVMEMHRNGCHRYWKYGSQDNTIEVIDYTNNREDVPAENTLWCFVGNLMDGFVIYNMAAGANMTVNATVDGDKPILGTADPNINRWYIVPSGVSTEPNAFCLTHDKSRYMNHQNGKVYYWAQTDNGSTCYINEAEQFIFSLGVEDLAQAHKVGAIGVKGHGTQEAQNLVDNYEDVNNNSNFDLAQLQALVASFKAVKNSSVEAEGPKDGYYFIYNVGGKGNGGSINNSDWRLTYDGINCKALPVNKDQKLGAQHVWYLQQSGNGFKMQSCNVGMFLGDLAQAPGVTTIASDEANASVYTLTNQNIDGKFTIKDGKNHILRTENNGDVNEWGTEHNEKWYLVEAADLDLDITAAGYATVYYPFDVTLPADGSLKAYAIEETNNVKGTVSLIAKENIPANKGAILKGEVTTHTLKIVPKSTTATVAATNWDNNKLKGSNVKTYVAENAYVLAKPQGKTVGLYKALLNKDQNGQEGSTHFQVNANRAYLPMLQSAAATVQFYGFDFNEDGTTGIENIEDAILNNGNAVIYDLSGRRVQNTMKGGIYIVNGKKVVR